MISLLYCYFWGFRLIGNRKNEYLKYSESELKKIWDIHPDIKPYYLGSYGLIIWRKDLIKFRDNIELVTNLNIIDNLDKHGNGGMNASDWNFLKDFFSEKYKTFFSEKGQKPFKLQSIIKD